MGTTAEKSAERGNAPNAEMARAAALIARFGLTAEIPPRVPVLPPAISARACVSGAMSESIEERRVSMFMWGSVAQCVLNKRTMVTIPNTHGNKKSNMTARM